MNRSEEFCERWGVEGSKLRRCSDRDGLGFWFFLKGIHSFVDEAGVFAIEFFSEPLGFFALEALFPLACRRPDTRPPGDNVRLFHE